MARLRDRPTGDLLILLVAVTVCGSVMVSGGAIILLAIFQPDFDVTNAARNVTDLLNTLVGLLAGFVAGRTDLGVQRKQDEINRLREEVEAKKPPKEGS